MENNVKKEQMSAEINEQAVAVELKDELLDEVNGGAGWAPWAVAVAIAAACSTLNDIHDAGKNVGQFIYYVTH